MKTSSLNKLGRIAILVVDIQNDFCHNDGAFSHAGLNVKPAQEVAPKIKDFIKKTRKYNLPVIYSKMVESEQLTPRNLRRLIDRGKLINTEQVCAPNSWGAEFYEIKPTGKDYVLEKITYDVFSNAELLEILKSYEITTLVIVGVNTDVCIDTAVRRAFTEGYQVIVPKDLVATMNKDGEQYCLTIFDRFFGDVVDSSIILSYLAAE